MAEVSVAVIVVELESEGGFSFVTASAKPFVAFVVSNPQLRAQAQTAEAAMELLRAVILGHFPKVKSRRLVELRFDDLLAEEVMGS